MVKWKVILATNPIPARKKRQQTGVTATSTRLSRPQWGETAIEMPRDRQASFDSIILPKHKRDVSDIENKVLAMYARGMSQRDISATIDAFTALNSVPSKFPKSLITCLTSKKVGKIGHLRRSIPSFSSTASLCPLSAITRRKSVPFTIFWA